MLKRHGILSENFTISFVKQEKLETCRNLKSTNFKHLYRNTRALDFKQLYIFYNFFSQQNEYIYLKELR